MLKLLVTDPPEILTFVAPRATVPLFVSVPPDMINAAALPAILPVDEFVIDPKEMVSVVKVPFVNVPLFVIDAPFAFTLTAVAERPKLPWLFKETVPNVINGDDCPNDPRFVMTASLPLIVIAVAADPAIAPDALLKVPPVIAKDLTLFAKEPASLEMEAPEPIVTVEFTPFVKVPEFTTIAAVPILTIVADTAKLPTLLNVPPVKLNVPTDGANELVAVRLESEPPLIVILAAD